MKTKLSDPLYWMVVKKTRKISLKIRTLERNRIRRKENNIQKRDNDCSRHQVCRWIRKIRDQYKKDGLLDEDDDAEETKRRENKMETLLLNAEMSGKIE